MVVRKTDSEFGGRGGLHPPAEFVPPVEELEAWEQASLMRRTDGPGRPVGNQPDDAVAARAEREKRARLNDKVGR